MKPVNTLSWISFLAICALLSTSVGHAQAPRTTINLAPVVNTAPTANAGPDQTSAPQSTITLLGSGSTDADGDPLSYSWHVLSRPLGSRAVPSDPFVVNPTFTLDVSGTYALQLIVHDGTANSPPDIVIVSTFNSAPLANAGRDQKAFVKEVVGLNGGASSDVDGNMLTFAWNLVRRPPSSTTTLVGAMSPNPMLLVDAPGSYVVQLSVHDGLVASGPDFVVITTQNLPPIADSGPDQGVLFGDTVTLNGSGSTDVDGDTLQYAWSLISAPAGSVVSLSDPSAPMAFFVADTFGTYVAQLIVHDGVVASVPETVTITTQNPAPVANAGLDQSAVEGLFVLLNGNGSYDVDGDRLMYVWALTTRPPGSFAMLTDATSTAPWFVVDLPGTYVAQLIVNDGTMTSAPDTVTINTANSRPTANSGPDRIGLPAASAVTLDGSLSSDADGHPLHYSWSFTALPGGSAATLTGADTATPVFAPDVPGDYVVQLIVSDGLARGEPDTVLIQVQGADLTPTVTVEATDAAADEVGPAGPGVGMFTFTRTGPMGAALLVCFTTGGTATVGSDYANVVWTDVWIPAGKTSVTKTVTPVLDGVVEPNETVVVTLTAGTYVVGTPATATVTIAEHSPTITVVATDPTADEVGPAGPDVGTFTFTRTGPTGAALWVRFTTGGTATVGADYANVVWTDVWIPAGKTSVTKTVTPVLDGVVEPNETVVVTLTAGTYVVGTPATATVTIAEHSPTITVVATDAAADEVGPAGPDVGTFTFTRTGPTGAALWVRFTTGGTATVGADYANVVWTDVWIPAGKTSVTKTVTPVLDGVVEPNETVVVTLTAGTYVVGTPATATVTIAEHSPTITVVATDAAADEVGPAGPDVGTFTFTRTGPTGAALWVRFTTGGTATVGADYANVVWTDVWIPAGKTSVTKTVTPVLDGVVEPNETVVVTLTAGTYVVGTPATATVTIAEHSPTITVVATDLTADEVGPAGPDVGTFTFTRTGPTGAALWVRFTTGGTATVGADYANVVWTDVWIPAGKTSVTKTVTPVLDGVVEPNETVVVTLTAGTYIIGTPATATLTIVEKSPR